MNNKRIILFRGGMCGDLVLAMIDKNALLPPGPKKGYFTINEYRIKKYRTKMKKFFIYTDKQKKGYYNNLTKTVLSHDTDYLLNLDNVVQIICSSQSKIINFAKRFEQIYPVDNEKKSSFVENYTQSITDWQKKHQFERKFDIASIGNTDFLHDVCSYFNVSDTNWANNIYEDWCKKEEYLL